jgi:hypothetical protein
VIFRGGIASFPQNALVAGVSHGNDLSLADILKMCAFCPTEAAKLSREHLWDDWLIEHSPTKDSACAMMVTGPTVQGVAT